MGLVEKGGIRQTRRKDYQELFWGILAWLNIYDLGLFEHEVHPTGHTAIFRHPPLQPRGDNVFVKLPSPDWISLSFSRYSEIAIGIKRTVVKLPKCYKVGPPQSCLLVYKAMKYYNYTPWINPTFNQVNSLCINLSRFRKSAINQISWNPNFCWLNHDIPMLVLWFSIGSRTNGRFMAFW